MVLVNTKSSEWLERAANRSRGETMNLKQAGFGATVESERIIGARYFAVLMLTAAILALVV